MAIVSLLCCGCVETAGHFRPAWSPAWTRLTCKPAAVTEAVIFVALEGKGPLPGMPVRITSVTGKVTEVYTNAAGEARLSLVASTYALSSNWPGITPWMRRISVAPAHSCHLDVFVVMRGGTVIQ